MGFRFALVATYLAGFLITFFVGLYLIPHAHASYPLPVYDPPVGKRIPLQQKHYTDCRPAFRGDQPIGLACSFLREENALFQFGLNDGDIIVEYNGLKIADPRDIAKMELWIQNRPPQTIRVKRGTLSVLLSHPL